MSIILYHIINLSLKKTNPCFSTKKNPTLCVFSFHTSNMSVPQWHPATRWHGCYVFCASSPTYMLQGDVLVPDHPTVLQQPSLVQKDQFFYVKNRGYVVSMTPTCTMHYSFWGKSLKLLYISTYHTFALVHFLPNGCHLMTPVIGLMNLSLSPTTWMDHGKKTKS